MGKSLVIKGADFSANGIPETIPAYNITALVAESGCWYPRNRVADLNAYSKISSTNRSCILRYDLDSVTGIENYSKIRITFAIGIDYVFGFGQDGVTSSFIRVTGINTSDTEFGWVTDNQVAEYEIGIRDILNINIRFDDNTTDFPENAILSDYMTIELVP